LYHADDTIAAIASAPGGAARGIVRVSGPDTASILATCFRTAANVDLSDVCAATAFSGTLKLSGSAVRELGADVYFWPDGRSYTRQPVAEIHTLGAPPLVAGVLRTVCAAGARLAEPGEFTLRAFLAGRIDLTQAEAVLGIIDARGERELQAALSQLAGGLAMPLEKLRNSLLDLLAHLEAGLDFVEDDIQFISPEQLQSQLDEAREILEATQSQIQRRELHDDLPRVALLGWPNVGKSSLFNALSEQGAALVSAQPGTTRDYLANCLDLNGVAFRLIDTAGVEVDVQMGNAAETNGADIAAIAQRMTASQAEACEIRLLCIDSTRPLNAWEQQELRANHFAKQLVVLTKCDSASKPADRPPGAVETSAVSGRGVDDLRRELQTAVLALKRSQTAGSTPQRCAASLSAAAESLSRASELNRTRAGEELIAAEVRMALTELGKVVGAVYTDDILDRIFSRFCIGK